MQRSVTPLLRGIKSPFPGARSPDIDKPIAALREPIPTFCRNTDSEVGTVGTMDAFDIFVSSLPRQCYSSRTCEIVTYGEPHLLRLPLKVRFLIYDFLTESERDKDMKVVLSPPNTVAYFWPEAHFIEPSDVFDYIGNASESCWQLRHELMTYYCTQFHFHITYNYFCTPFVARIIHRWLPLFANRLQYLTVEVDFTRLGGSYKNGAFPLPHGQEEMAAFVEKLISQLATRENSIQSVHFMCRRYKGLRPISQDKLPAIAEPMKYCPNARTHILDKLSVYIGARGTPIHHIRLTGFPTVYTRDILTLVSVSDFGSPPIIDVPDFDPWPTIEPANIPLPETPAVRVDSPPGYRFVGSNVVRLSSGSSIMIPSKLSNEIKDSDIKSPDPSSRPAQSADGFSIASPRHSSSSSRYQGQSGYFGLGFDVSQVYDKEARLLEKVQTVKRTESRDELHELTEEALALALDRMSDQEYDKLRQNQIQRAISMRDS